MTAYEYRDALSYLSRWSNRRSVTAKAIADIWTLAGMPAVASCLDVGSGDGELLEGVLGHLGEDSRPSHVWLLEPDSVLAVQARARLHRLGVVGELIADVDLRQQKTLFSHVLAAHVVYYLLPLSQWLNEIGMCLPPEGLLTLVIRGEQCDTYRLRELVRIRRGLSSRLTQQGLVDDLMVCGYKVLYDRTVEATLEVPHEVCVTDGGDRIVNDADFELFLRWMARLPPEERFEEALYADFRSFLRTRRSGSGMRLRLQDRIVVAKRI